MCPRNLSSVPAIVVPSYSVGPKDGVCVWVLCVVVVAGVVAGAVVAAAGCVWRFGY